MANKRYVLHRKDEESCKRTRIGTSEDHTELLLFPLSDTTTAHKELRLGKREQVVPDDLALSLFSNTFPGVVVHGTGKGKQESPAEVSLEKQESPGLSLFPLADVGKIKVMPQADQPSSSQSPEHVDGEVEEADAKQVYTTSEKKENSLMNRILEKLGTLETDVMLMRMENVKLKKQTRTLEKEVTVIKTENLQLKKESEEMSKLKKFADVYFHTDTSRISAACSLMEFSADIISFNMRRIIASQLQQTAGGLNSANQLFRRLWSGSGFIEDVRYDSFLKKQLKAEPGEYSEAGKLQKQKAGAEPKAGECSKQKKRKAGEMEQKPGEERQGNTALARKVAEQACKEFSILVDVPETVVKDMLTWYIRFFEATRNHDAHMFALFLDPAYDKESWTRKKTKGGRATPRTEAELQKRLEAVLTPPPYESFTVREIRDKFLVVRDVIENVSQLPMQHKAAIAAVGGAAMNEVGKLLARLLQTRDGGYGLNRLLRVRQPVRVTESLSWEAWTGESWEKSDCWKDFLTGDLWKQLE